MMKRSTRAIFVMVLLVVVLAASGSLTYRAYFSPSNFVKKVDLDDLISRFEGSKVSEEEMIFNIGYLQSGWTLNRLEPVAEEEFCSRFSGYNLIPLVGTDSDKNVVYVIHFYRGSEDLVYQKGGRVFSPGMRRLWRRDQWELLAR